MPAPESLYTRAYRQLGWEVELVRRPTQKRANDATDERELVEIAVFREEARLLGRPVEAYVAERTGYVLGSTLKRRIRAARELVDREPGWRLAVEGRASINLSERGL